MHGSGVLVGLVPEQGVVRLLPSLRLRLLYEVEAEQPQRGLQKLRLGVRLVQRPEPFLILLVEIEELPVSLRDVVLPLGALWKPVLQVIVGEQTPILVSLAFFRVRVQNHHLAF